MVGRVLLADWFLCFSEEMVLAISFLFLLWFRLWFRLVGDCLLCHCLFPSDCPMCLPMVAVVVLLEGCRSPMAEVVGVGTELVVLAFDKDCMLVRTFPFEDNNLVLVPELVRKHLGVVILVVLALLEVLESLVRLAFEPAFEVVVLVVSIFDLPCSSLPLVVIPVGMVAEQFVRVVVVLMVVFVLEAFGCLVLVLVTVF